MSLLLIRPEIDTWKPGEHNGTFRGNNLAFVAAKAAIEFGTESGMYVDVNRKSALVKNFLENEVKPLLPSLEVRGIGLIWGIDFAKCGDSGLCRRVLDECFKRHLLIEQAGRGDQVLKPMPALTITDEELTAGLTIIRDSLKACLA